MLSLALSRLNPAAWQKQLEQLGELDPNASCAFVRVTLSSIVSVNANVGIVQRKR
jgi:hypothetical protein